MSYTMKQRNRFYKKLRDLFERNGVLLYSDYYKITKDSGYNFRFHSIFPELALFEPCREAYRSEIEKAQPIALDFCIAMTEN